MPGVVATAAANWGLTAAALVVAVATFVMSQITVARRAKTDYVDQLEKRLSICEADRADLRHDIQTLRDENLGLMQRMFRLEEGGRP